MAKQKNDSKNEKKNNANNTKDTEKDSSTKKTKSTTKTRDTLNISIQKRNYNEINNIINSWYKNDLNVSNETCKAILLQDELQNNPYIQILLSTLDLLRTNLKNKNLYEQDFQSALFEAFNNIISIKINAHELTNFLENESYFKNNNIEKDSPNMKGDLEHNNTNNNRTLKSEEETQITTKQNNNKMTKSNTIITNTEINTNLKTENIHQPQNNPNPTEFKGDILTKEKTNLSEEKNQDKTDNLIHWSFPKEPTFPSQDQNNLEDILNKKLGVFSYEN